MRHSLQSVDNQGRTRGGINLNGFISPKMRCIVPQRDIFLTHIIARTGSNYTLKFMPSKLRPVFTPVDNLQAIPKICSSVKVALLHPTFELRSSNVKRIRPPVTGWTASLAESSLLGCCHLANDCINVAFL